jgi:hypothetical protein
MKKQDLKTGMILELRDGSRRFVLLNSINLLNDTVDTTSRINPEYYKKEERMNDFFDLYHWTDDLMSDCNIGSRLDVMKVLNPYNVILWERKELPSFKNLNELADYMQTQIDRLNKLISE